MIQHYRLRQWPLKLIRSRNNWLVHHGAQNLIWSSPLVVLLVFSLVHRFSVWSKLFTFGFFIDFNSISNIVLLSLLVHFIAIVVVIIIWLFCINKWHLACQLQIHSVRCTELANKTCTNLISLAILDTRFNILNRYWFKTAFNIEWAFHANHSQFRVIFCLMRNSVKMDCSYFASIAFAPIRYTLWILFCVVSKFLSCFHGLLSRFVLQKLEKIGQYVEQNTFVVRFCGGTNLHGFNHIANKKYTVFERFSFNVSDFYAERMKNFPISF